MENLTFVNVLMLILGLSLHILVSMKKAVLDNDEEFSLGYFLSDNWISLLIGVITGFVSLFFADTLITFLGLYADPDAAFYGLHSFLSGYLGREWIFRVIDKIKK